MVSGVTDICLTLCVLCEVLRWSIAIILWIIPVNKHMLGRYLDYSVSTDTFSGSAYRSWSLRNRSKQTIYRSDRQISVLHQIFLGQPSSNVDEDWKKKKNCSWFKNCRTQHTRRHRIVYVMYELWLDRFTFISTRSTESVCQ